MELRQYITIGFKWWWLLAMMTITAAATGYFVSINQAPVYQAAATILVGQATQASDLNTADLLISERLARTYADIARRQPALQGVVDTLQLQDDWQTLKQRVSVTPVRDTQLLEISVEAASAEEARVTADELARQLIKLSPTALENEANAENRQYVRQRLANLQGKIEAGQARLKELETAMQGSVSAEQVKEFQTEMNDLEALLTEWENNHTQLLILVESKKSPNYLAVIEPAQATAAPVRPKIAQNTLLAGVVGLLLALGVVFLLEYLDDTIKSKTDVAQVLGLTPLGAVSRIRGKEYPDKLVTTVDLFSPIAEAYRVIRSNIQFAAVDRPLKSIMVTSPTPAEGKSVTVANLGVVLAQAGLKTIIVDADLRRPVQHQIFQIPIPGGLTDLLCSPDLDPRAYLRRTEIDHLWVLTSGALPPNPSELLGSRRMSNLLARLGEEADIILLDSPPALLVADPVVLSNKTDGVVLVFEAGSTRFGAAGQTMANLEQAGAAVVGAILNQVKEGRGGYYYHHHYRYYSPNGVSANGHQPAGQPLPAAKPRRLPRWLPFGKE